MAERAKRLPSGLLSSLSSHSTSFKGTASRAPTVSRAADFAVAYLLNIRVEAANLASTYAVGRAEGQDSKVQVMKDEV